jgi:hypothetical protein
MFGYAPSHIIMVQLAVNQIKKVPHALHMPHNVKVNAALFGYILNY